MEENKKEKNLLKFVGFVWELVGDMKPEDILEPSYPIKMTENPMGEMLEIEKILFTLREDFFASLALLFKVEMEDAEAVDIFDNWLFEATRDEFILECRDNNYDVLRFLDVRRQFFDINDLLEIITAQHLDVDRDDFIFYYRQGFLISIQRENLFIINDN